ncbi:MAG: hypothetical protein A2511_17725 [Deltaproteobacteria bacterium RIFOXYD12_FULL_50_9]|nr:MAG: hypothetical protein A2511_17725 [Deltaproteobacteria bacterium RIFOXYD12_FULL_50_9]
MIFSIKPLLVGVREVDQGIMTYQRAYGRRIWLAMWSFLIRSDNHAILVDTGMDDFVTPKEFTLQTGLEPKFMDEALLDNGLKPDDITMVINTHLHDDHCGNNRLFSKALFFIQEKEIESCHNPHPLDYRYEPDFIEGLQVQAVKGDLEILPGLKVFFTPGHTPGGQTVQVVTSKGLVVIPGFCSNRHNFPASGPAVCPGVHCDAYLAFDTAQRVKNMGGTVLPLHELDLANML